MTDDATPTLTHDADAPTVTVGSRFTPEEIALIDAEVTRIAAEHPGLQVSRAGVVRGCTLRILARTTERHRRGV